MSDSRLRSLVQGTDSQVLRLLFENYPSPPGRVVDLTANTRRMWKGLDSSAVTFCDIDPAMKPDVICDWKQTPFADGECAVLVFDPPHLPLAASSAGSDPGFSARFGLGRSVAGDNIASVFSPFLAEAVRILAPDGLIFAKLADYVHNHAYQWMLCEFVLAVKLTPGLTPCDLIVKADPRAGRLMSSKWEKRHHCRKAHCWWVVVRKGRCEAKHNVASRVV